MSTLGDLTSVLRFVLPGLVVAWVFYGLTSYEKPGEFERVAQALVFTALLEVLSRGLHSTGVLVGNLSGLHLPVPDTVTLSTLLAIPFGLAVAHSLNNDTIHSWLRRHAFTAKSGRADQWDTAFRVCGPYAVLDLMDGRRVFGLMIEWPDRPSQGHFILREQQWIDASGQALSKPAPGAILVSAKEVTRVEFVEKMEDPGNRL